MSQGSRPGNAESAVRQGYFGKNFPHTKVVGFKTHVSLSIIASRLSPLMDNPVEGAPIRDYYNGIILGLEPSDGGSTPSSLTRSAIGVDGYMAVFQTVVAGSNPALRSIRF